jgi:hypothetical protein
LIFSVHLKCATALYGTGNFISWFGDGAIHHPVHTFTTPDSKHHTEPQLQIKGYSSGML